MRMNEFRGRCGAFTLIEIMVVVVILGVLAATIIPQFIGTTHDAKVSTAKAHVAELEAAIERFNIHMDRYPTAEEGLKVLVERPGAEAAAWRGPYIKNCGRIRGLSPTSIDFQGRVIRRASIYGRGERIGRTAARVKERTSGTGDHGA
jgi:prepilin-type N-terminal cleavage/methylation domain-containing protein